VQVISEERLGSMECEIGYVEVQWNISREKDAMSDFVGKDKKKTRKR
jgi:hypothetical protein